MVVPIRPADAPHTLERVFVAEVPPERVAGIGRIGDDAPLAHDIRCLADEARLGCNGV
jgi:hypothetical protein